MRLGATLGSALLLSVLVFVPLISVALGDVEPEVSATQSVPAAGRGWFVFKGCRHNFGFVVKGGELSEADGWIYKPKGYLFLEVFNLRRIKIFDLRSVLVWRYRIEEVDGGFKVVIAGVANAYTPMGVFKGWWFRAEARDVDGVEESGDSFSILLWRSGGADKLGCWTARLFNPQDPTSLKLNPIPFYRAFGRLKGGFVEVTT